MSPALVTGLFALLSAGAAVSPRATTQTIEASRPVTRRLIGDGEPAERYVITLAAGWPRTYPALLEALAAEAPVTVFVQADAGMRAARRFVAGLPAHTRDRITLRADPVDSPWIRDYGPLQVREASGGITWLDAVYEERPLDDDVPARLALEWSVPVESFPVSFDGGALVSDGQGHCVSTSDYLDAQGIDRAGPRLKRELMPALGCETLLVVPALLDEDTGHVDMFLQFLGPETVGIASVDPDLDPDQAARLDGVATAVNRFSARRGLDWTIVRVAMGVDLSGDLFPYINGIHLPHTFLMPSYHPRPTPTETRAAEALSAAMPGTRVVRIPTAQMADLGGALHCAVLGIRRAPATERAG